MQPGPLKIVVLGEGRVGKTSLLRRFVFNKFDDGEESTQNASYLEKTLWVRSREVKLSLWDTAGQERFHSLAPIYYRDAHGALLVYDTTDVESFRRVARWVDELKVQGKDCPIHLVGNKIDLRAQRKVDDGEAEGFARGIRATHNLASAKTEKGVEEAFKLLIESIMDASAGVSRPPAATGRRSKVPVFTEDPIAPRVAGGGRGVVAGSAAVPASSSGLSAPAPSVKFSPSPADQPPPMYQQNGGSHVPDPDAIATATIPDGQRRPPTSADRAGTSFKLEPPKQNLREKPGAKEKEKKCC